MKKDEEYSNVFGYWEGYDLEETECMQVDVEQKEMLVHETDYMQVDAE
jgi:hypothetical protein